MFMEDFVVGGNARDVHTVDVNIEDFKVEGFYDLKIAEPGTYAHDAEAPTLHQRALRWGTFLSLD